jgi:hypothetical protein
LEPAHLSQLLYIPIPLENQDAQFSSMNKESSYEIFIQVLAMGYGITGPMRTQGEGGTLCY